MKTKKNVNKFYYSPVNYT